MKIENIEVADIPLIRSIYKKVEFTFIFPEIYLIKEQQYAENYAIKIKSWKNLQAIAFISQNPNSFVRKNIEQSNLEEFDLIQEIALWIIF